MPEFNAQSEIEGLRAIVSDLTSKLSRISVPAEVDTEEPAAVATTNVPYWEVTLATSLTLTQGISDDWDPRFDDLSVATNRRKSRKVTAAGEFQYIHIGASTGKRFKICWESDTAQTILGHITGMPTGTTGGYIQVKLNGQLYEYDVTASQEYWVTMEGIEGRNQLVVSVQYGPFYPIFEAVLFDGKTSRWVEPSDEQGFVSN